MYLKKLSFLQAASLSDFYEVCKGLELARNFQFPVLREACLCNCVNFMLWFSKFFLFIFIMGFPLFWSFQPPQSFLTTMEEYIREAPRVVTVPSEPLVSTFILCIIGMVPYPLSSGLFRVLLNLARHQCIHFLDH